MTESKQKPKLWKRLIRWSVGLAIVAIVGYIGLFMFCTWCMHSSWPTYIAEYSSPTIPENRLLFWEPSGPDRSIWICVPTVGNESKDAKPWTAIYDEEGGTWFHHANWTADGQVILIASAPKAWDIAFDFTNNRHISTTSGMDPDDYFVTEQIAMTHGDQATFDGLIQQHGGLHEERIDMERYRAEARKKGYWEHFPVKGIDSGILRVMRKAGRSFRM